MTLLEEEMKMSNKPCDQCSKTGILSASLVSDPETGARYVQVIPCENHTDSILATKNVESIIDKSGYSVMVVS